MFENIHNQNRLFLDHYSTKALLSTPGPHFPELKGKFTQFYKFVAMFS